ncbi:hypothetical protein JZ751_020188 [Albula glossodonta]|uniref:Uncharacterized protein n=1 Tax=Albula glossodonta TaxID=121402 RepID=A0A8T2NJV1_9TELE|nr:hypothetical protein JZ751_020188 [Albula glossodonta]
METKVFSSHAMIKGVVAMDRQKGAEHRKVFILHSCWAPSSSTFCKQCYNGSQCVSGSYSLRAQILALFGVVRVELDVWDVGSLMEDRGSDLAEDTFPALLVFKLLPHRPSRPQLFCGDFCYWTVPSVRPSIVWPTVSEGRQEWAGTEWGLSHDVLTPPPHNPQPPPPNTGKAVLLVVAAPGAVGMEDCEPAGRAHPWKAATMKRKAWALSRDSWQASASQDGCAEGQPSQEPAEKKAPLTEETGRIPSKIASWLNECRTPLGASLDEQSSTLTKALKMTCPWEQRLCSFAPTCSSQQAQTSIGSLPTNSHLSFTVSVAGRGVLRLLWGV